MAYYKSNNRYSNKKKKSKYSPIEKFAFNMGLVNQQLPLDSRVSDSYIKGNQTKPPKLRENLCLVVTIKNYF